MKTSYRLLAGEGHIKPSFIDGRPVDQQGSQPKIEPYKGQDNKIYPSHKGSGGHLLLLWSLRHGASMSNTSKMSKGEPVSTIDTKCTHHLPNGPLNVLT